MPNPLISTILCRMRGMQTLVRRQQLSSKRFHAA